MRGTLRKPWDELLVSNEAEIARLAAADGRSWWIRGRRSLIAAVVGRYAKGPTPGTIGDLGCGAGAMSEVLKKYGRVIGIDRSPLSVQLCRTKGYAALILGTVEQLPLNTGSLVLASMTDVLEHIQDDEGVIRECARVLRPGGILVLTVPAFPWLYSEHDRALGHFRRYAPRQLVELLRRNGFEVERITHFNTTLLPAVVLLRLFRSLRRRTMLQADPLNLPGALNNLARAILAAERYALQVIDLPLGVSLLCVARNRSS